MKKILSILFTLILANSAFSQSKFDYPYFPDDSTLIKDWKVQFSAFGDESSNSNSLSNDFMLTIDKSRFLDDELIDKQLSKLKHPVIAGQIRNIGVGAMINSLKKNGKQYIYFGIEHWRFLDTYLNEDLVKLILLGNKPFAGQTLTAPDSKYQSIYYNQFKAGMGHIFNNGKTFHHLSWNLSLNIGQNYNFLQVQNSSLYTEPDGDYLDVTAIANTQLSDTVWAEVYEMNGLGISADVEYTFSKPGNFHFGLTLKNLGFIHWSGNTFSGEIDTSFVFEGFVMDTVANQNDNLPVDYSIDGIRNLLFKNPDYSPFNTSLPVSVRLSAGKYFAGNRFFAGFNGSFYPFLSAQYMFEFFATWNYKNTLYITPLVAYSGYEKVNYGLSIGLNIHDKVSIHAGSVYLNSMFDKEETLGQGGFVRLTYRY